MPAFPPKADLSLARSEELERSTFGFEARLSIQLTMSGFAQAARSRPETRGREAVQRPSSERSIGKPQLSHNAV